MKILAEVKSFSVLAAVAEIRKAHAEKVKGTHAEGIELGEGEVFLALADLHPEVTFILLDGQEKIIGWRN